MKTLTVKSKKPIVAITLDEYEGMKETIEILSSNPGIRTELEKERKAIEEGDFITLNDFKNKLKAK